jgi:CRISPR-associated protein Csx3
MSQPVKVVLCGPPQSGKSCLREGLKQAILSLERLGKAPYPFVLTACPDGEGAWYAEAVRNNPQLAKELKAAYKRKFTWEFAQQKANDVKNLSLPLNIIDVGGKISAENRLIMQHATDAVIVAGDMSKVDAWQEFCLDLKLKIIAIIRSDLHGNADCIESESPILVGSIHNLQRGVDVSQRPMVQRLAELLVKLSNG